MDKLPQTEEPLWLHGKNKIHNPVVNSEIKKGKPLDLVFQDPPHIWALPDDVTISL